MEEIINRLKDLADRSFQNGQYTFTNFLSVGEITIFKEHEKELSYAQFADGLNHRDFLGALMNLGIKREMLGDILVIGKEACVFCKDRCGGCKSVQSVETGYIGTVSGGIRAVNGMICTENAKILNPGDVVSARGHGKFDFAEQLGLSKKGKLNCKVMVY